MLSCNTFRAREPSLPAKSISLGACALLCICMLVPGRAALAAPQVVASIAPLHALVAAVMQGVGSPRLLLRGGESPHSFSLRPSEVRLLRQADIVFWIGPTLELPLARVLPNLTNAQTVAMLDVAGVERLPTREFSVDPHADAGHDADHRHAVGAPDPHIWLSPVNATGMAREITRRLVVLDPANAATYRVNAVRLEERLSALDRRLARQFDEIDGHFAVFHDAYQYLEHRYGLHAVGSVTSHPERSPGIAHLQALRTRLVENAVRCLFSEPQFQPRLIAALGEGLAIRHAVLDPLGADIPPGPDAYEAMMLAIADRFTACMQEGTTP